MYFLKANVSHTQRATDLDRQAANVLPVRPQRLEQIEIQVYLPVIAAICKYPFPRLFPIVFLRVALSKRRCACGGNRVYPPIMKARPNLKVVVCSGCSMGWPCPGDP